jgi:hypothetical protein
MITALVQPYPGGGAADPAWSKKSNELFYRLGGQMMSVPFTVAGGSFQPGKPVLLFDPSSLRFVLNWTQGIQQLLAPR